MIFLITSSCLSSNKRLLDVSLITTTVKRSIQTPVLDRLHPGSSCWSPTSWGRCAGLPGTPKIAYRLHLYSVLPAVTVNACCAPLIDSTRSNRAASFFYALLLPVNDFLRNSPRNKQYHHYNSRYRNCSSTLTTRRMHFQNLGPRVLYYDRGTFDLRCDCFTPAIECLGCRVVPACAVGGG